MAVRPRSKQSQSPCHGDQSLCTAGAEDPSQYPELIKLAPAFMSDTVLTLLGEVKRYSIENQIGGPLTMADPRAVSSLMRQFLGTLTTVSRGCIDVAAAAPLKPPNSASKTSNAMPLSSAHLHTCTQLDVVLNRNYLCQCPTFAHAACSQLNVARYQDQLTSEDLSTVETLMGCLGVRWLDHDGFQSSKRLLLSLFCTDMMHVACMFQLHCPGKKQCEVAYQMCCSTPGA